MFVFSLTSGRKSNVSLAWFQTAKDRQGHSFSGALDDRFHTSTHASHCRSIVFDLVFDSDGHC